MLLQAILSELDRAYLAREAQGTNVASSAGSTVELTPLFA